MKMVKFELTENQIEFLKKNYSNSDVVGKVLSSEEERTFCVDVDTQIDFMSLVEDESVSWMDENYEASEETYMLESIYDTVYEQTND